MLLCIFQKAFFCIKHFTWQRVFFYLSCRKKSKGKLATFLPYCFKDLLNFWIDPFFDLDLTCLSKLEKSSLIQNSKLNCNYEEHLIIVWKIEKAKCDTNHKIHCQAVTLYRLILSFFFTVALPLHLHRGFAPKIICIYSEAYTI